MMSRVRRSLLLSAMGNNFGLVLQIVVTMVLARVLTPAEMGVFGVAAVFAALASTFRDFGVAEFLIQERTVDDDCVRAALTVNIAVSWLMAVTLLVGSWPAAEFYANAGVGSVMRVQAVAFIFVPFGAVTMAWFRREMNFRPIVVSTSVAEVVSFAVAIWLALDGHSYMSMAWASLAGAATTVACSIYFRPPAFPRWPGMKGIRRVVDFGKFASGIYIVGQLGKGAPEMIIGRAQDMAAVGMFGRANGLVDVFNRLVLSAVTPICLPFFASTLRAGGELKGGLTRVMAYLSVIGWTVFGVIALTSYGLVRILYGEQWLGAVHLAQLLCAVAALELLYFPSREALLALGRAREGNHLQLWIQGLRVAALLAVVPFGLVGACIGLFVAAVLGAVLAFVFLHRARQVDALQMLKALGSSALVAILALAPGIAIVWNLPMTEDNFLGTTIVCCLTVFAAWAVCLFALKHPLAGEIQRLLGLSVRKDGGSSSKQPR